MSGIKYTDGKFRKWYAAGAPGAGNNAWMNKQRRQPRNPCFPAKYEGTCGACNQKVHVGNRIYYAAKGRVLHEECWRELR